MTSLEKLERYYNHFIGQENARDFFIGLADYWDYAEAVPEFDWITTQISNEPKPLMEKLAAQEKSALEKIRDVRKEIGKYVRKKNLNDTEAGRALREFDDFDEGRAHSTGSLADTLHVRLFDSLRFLYESADHHAYAKKFVTYPSPHDKQAVEYLPLQELKNFHETKSELDRAYNTALWGAQAQLYELYDIIKNGRKKYYEIVERHRKKDKGAALDLFTHAGPVAEWEAIIEGRTDRNTVLFIIKDIKPQAQRFHTHVVVHLDEAHSAIMGSSPVATKVERGQQIQDKQKPELSTLLIGRKEVGFFKFNKMGKKIPIGGSGTRVFRLLDALMDPHFGVQKTVESVFDAIKRPNDETDALLSDDSKASYRIRTIIDNTWKEVIRIKEMQGKMRVKYSNNGRTVYLDWR